MNAPNHKLANLRVNPDWAKLPLFDQKGWKRVRFGDVVQVLKEQVDPASGEVDRYVAGEHMDSESVHIRRWGTVGDGYLGPAFIRRFRKGQVLYGSRRTYLKKVAIAEWDGITANTTLVLEAVQGKLLQELLPWLMLSERFTRHSIQESKGSTNPYINWPDIAKYEFKLPSLAEQRRIAKLLWTMNEVEQLKISIGQNANSYLASVIESSLDKMYRGPSEHLARLWPQSPDSGCSAHPRDVDTGHYVLSLTALSARGYVQGNLKPVEPTREMRAACLARGDFLISRSNTQELVGYVGVFDEDRTDVSFPDTMMRLHIDERQIQKRFLELVLLSARGRRHMMRSAAGTSGSMKKINRQTLGECLVPTPPLKLQEALLEKVRDLRDATRDCDSAVTRSQSIKFAITNELFA